MVFLTSLLSAIGFLAIAFGIGYVISEVVDFHIATRSDIRDCKREIERLEKTVKGLQSK